MGAGLPQGLEVGHVVEELWGEADDVENEEGVGAVGAVAVVVRSVGCSAAVMGVP